MKNVYEFLKERGLIYQATNETEVKKLLNGPPITFYLGIDPTADSMHLGHFCSLMIFKYLQQAGHRGVLVLGGATAMIGDPSGRSDLRLMMSREKVDENVKAMLALCSKFIDLSSESGAKILNNNDWMSKFSYVDFLRDVGAYFNVNVMLSAEAYKNRLENGGLTFLEMGYMPIQAHDFEHLYFSENCRLEIGGCDQWGNIVAGVELMRKKHAISVCAVTTPLLLNSEGKKMGKTAKGAVWVDPKRMSAYEFYQYFINIGDQDVSTLLRWFTTIPVVEIENMCNVDIRSAKKKMAYILTEMIHGQKNAQEAVQISENLFSAGGGMTDNMPEFKFDKFKLKEGIPLCELLTEAKICATRSEARRIIEQGGICINDSKILEIKHIVKMDKPFVIKRGKKIFIKICPV